MSEYDTPDDPRQLAAQIARSMGGPGFSRRPTGHDHPANRELPQPVRDPEAARPLKEIFDVAAQGGMPSKRELDALRFADDVSDYRRRKLLDEIIAACSDAVQARKAGALADARHLARVALGRYAGHLTTERVDPYADAGLDPRKLADLIPRDGIPRT